MENHDLGTRILQGYNSQGVPDACFLGKNGALQEPFIGPMTPPKPEKIITRILAEP